MSPWSGTKVALYPPFSSVRGYSATYQSWRRFGRDLAPLKDASAQRLRRLLAGLDASRNADPVDDVEVVHERDRGLLKDLIRRVDSLESVLKALRPDLFS